MREIAVSFQVCPAENAADRQRMRSQLNRQCFLLQKCNLFAAWIRTACFLLSVH